MYHLISKSLYFLLSPLTWILIVLVTAMLKSAWRKKLLLTAVLLLVVFGNEFLYRKVVVLWEVESIAYQAIPPAKTAFVMGGLLNVEQHLGQFDLTDNVDRALVPLYLMQEGRLQQMVISGGRNDKNHPHFNNYQLYKEYLGSLGFDTSNIYVETQARNSYENALFGKAFMQERNLLQEPILLVTSAIHMRRSMACFKKQGLAVVPVSIDSSLPNPEYSEGLSYYLWPQSATLRDWSVLLKEIVGLLVYKLLGYA